VLELHVPSTAYVKLAQLSCHQHCPALIIIYQLFSMSKVKLQQLASALLELTSHVGSHSVTMSPKLLSLARDVKYTSRAGEINIYILRLCYDVSVRLTVSLSVTEVHWCIIANLGFKC